MSLCTRNRWGTGSSYSSSKNEIDKEMETKLKKMRDERNKQDGMWLTAQTTTNIDSPKLYVSTSKVVDNK